jgi:hypothetical protein
MCAHPRTIEHAALPTTPNRTSPVHIHIRHPQAGAPAAYRRDPHSIPKCVPPRPAPRVRTQKRPLAKYKYPQPGRSAGRRPGDQLLLPQRERMQWAAAKTLPRLSKRARHTEMSALAGTAVERRTARRPSSEGCRGLPTTVGPCIASCSK